MGFPRSCRRLSAVYVVIPTVLAAVISHQVVELKFFPDTAVETFEAPRWGLHTLGQPHHARVRALGPRGPFAVDEVNSAPAASRRSQSL